MEKEQRKIRLLFTTPNLNNNYFLMVRREDWKEYLNNDVKSREEYIDGIQKWIKEDKIGAGEFADKYMSG